jgi:predicted ATPase
MMFAVEMLSYRKAIELPGPVVFDRGIPDVIGYLRLCGLPVHVSMMAAAKRCRYAKRVFIAPPWLAIFEQDAERKQSPREAKPLTMRWWKSIPSWNTNSFRFRCFQSRSV